MKKKFKFLAIAVLVAILTPVAGITYFAVGHSLSPQKTGWLRVNMLTNLSCKTHKVFWKTS